MYQFRLIGYPITHSLSPWIHERFFLKSNITGNYTLHEMQDFDKDIIAFKGEPVDGFNVTVPYKEQIIPYIDELDDSAKVIGAVNTVRVENGRWIGYNTDGIGYVRALQEVFPQLNDLTDKKIVILGAGGAAKGIYAAFVHKNPFQLTIANRTVEKAEKIIQLQPNRNNDQAISILDVENELKEADIIVQTSSVGMKPNIQQSIVTLPTLKETAIVSDIVYQPMETAFLTQAKQQQIAIHHGHTMLLYQAQYAFEIWTGTKPSVGNMATQLKKLLER